ncbi:hypothetical protein D11S_2286 (plasmid) [Aggregatibacter actinomycetemcomitans D11S-1]|uniref:lipoprotein n=1 Tax=Aggregatibacter actinomycetemcomitans TaxID=714 RepID=UPI0001BA152A|nr:lipoprotein [Aggregatibacter actinomycetemcomitans]ACX80359.1 hypothetical protein D11S_2286 [Aggregatibacter actinomycetemcomitans D11S-1]KOE62542.1 hypothetical protein D17P2_0302985 [Aggregatibacter actinomycetemcomitans serotype c str. D17P-2]
MKKLTLIIFSALILSACTSNLPPEPKSWKNDLSGVKEEQINTNPSLVTEVTGDKNVWSK